MRCRCRLGSSLIALLAPGLCLLSTGCVIDLDNLAAGGAGGARGTGGTTAASTGPGTGGATGTGTGTGGAAPVTAAQITAITEACTPYPGSTDFEPAAGQPHTVPICTLPGAVWWASGMTIACDGGKGAVCKAASGYSPNTAGTDSLGQPLDASTLPFVVVPPSSNGFDYVAAGLDFGSVAAVVTRAGWSTPSSATPPATRASCAARAPSPSRLGPPDRPQPETGGVSSGVTYLLFAGPGATVAKNEDHDEADQLGAQLAAKLVMSPLTALASPWLGGAPILRPMLPAAGSASA